MAHQPKHGLLPCLLVAAMLPAHQALGQDSSVMTLSPIQIFGAEDGITGVPGSASVVDDLELEQSRSISATDSLTTLPGVQVTPEDPLGRRPNVGIRGLNTRRSRKVHLLEDGVPIQLAPYGDTSTNYIPLARRLRGIEVIKGSGTIMYGPQTIGGTVNFLTRNPPLEQEVRITGSAGNRGYREAGVSAGGTYGNTGLLVDYVHQRADGLLRGQEQSVNDFMFKAVTEIEPEHRLTFKVSVLNENQRGGEAGQLLQDYREDQRRNRLPDDRFDVERIAGQITHEIRLNGSTSLSTNLYANTTERTARRQTGSSEGLANCPSGQNTSIVNASECGGQIRPREYRVMGVEPRITHRHDLFGRENELIAGIRYQNERGVREQFLTDTPRSNTRGSVRLNGNEDGRREVFDVDAFAAFVQNTSRFGNLSVTPGVRLERYEFQEVRDRTDGRPTESDSRRFTEVLPGVGLSWNGLEQVEIFGGVHRGMSPTQPDIGDRPDPEFSINYELGLRTAASAPVQGEVSIFYIDYDDIIATDNTAEGSNRFNAGKATLRGLEFFGRVDSWAFVDTDWNVYALARGTLLDTEYKRTVPGELERGNEFPYAPKFAGYLALGFETGPFDARVGMNYVGKQFSDDDNQKEINEFGTSGQIPSYTVFDASVNYRVNPDFTVFVAGRNLTDRKYIANLTDGVTAGPERTVYAGFDARF